MIVAPKVFEVHVCRESHLLFACLECLERCSPSEICSWRGPFSWPLAGIIQTFEDAKRDHPWEINIWRCAGKCWSDHSSCWRTQGWLKLLITIVGYMFEHYLNCDHFLDIVILHKTEANEITHNLNRNAWKGLFPSRGKAHGITCNKNSVYLGLFNWLGV